MKSPLRRFTDQIALAGMRPPLAPQLSLYRPDRDKVDLTGRRILLTGASSGIGEVAAEKFARLENAARSVTFGEPLMRTFWVSALVV